MLTDLVHSSGYRHIPAEATNPRSPSMEQLREYSAGFEAQLAGTPAEARYHQTLAKFEEAFRTAVYETNPKYAVSLFVPELDAVGEKSSPDKKLFFDAVRWRIELALAEAGYAPATTFGGAGEEPLRVNVVNNAAFVSVNS